MNLKAFFTKEYAVRFILFFLIAAAYVVLLRPGRAYMSQQWVKPVAEQLIEHSDRLYMENSRSVSFKVYLTSRDETTNDQEFTFGFPWGFYLVFPLILLVLVDKTNRFIWLHLVIQGILGVLMLMFFFAGLGISPAFLHLYKMFIRYLIPGAAFLLILFSLIGGRKLAAPDDAEPAQIS